MRIRRRPQQPPPPSDLPPPAPAPPPAATRPRPYALDAARPAPALHPGLARKEEEEVVEGEGCFLAQVLKGKQEEVGGGGDGGAYKTGNIGGVHSTTGSSSSGAKAEEDGGRKAAEASGGGIKKRRRKPAVLMEGSRCSRVNGRGWRCCQQTLVGYSLCEHHLGKGRLRSMSSVRPPGRGGRSPAAPAGRRKIGVVKARSISSLLHQTDQAAETAEAAGRGIGAAV